MNKIYLFGIASTLIILMITMTMIQGQLLMTTMAIVQSQGKFSGCIPIKSGELSGSDGSLLTLGYDEWGYNYQAHMFKGMYCDYHPIYRPGGVNHEWCIENYGDVKLLMWWNDAWISNRDCDEDGLLDRHYGSDGYIGSGAWETNHMWGTYEEDGKKCKWDYFTKIVAAPSDAYSDGGIWYTADNTEIGPAIWGDFATIQSIYNDPCAGDHGVEYLSPASPGFGYYKP